MIIEDIQSFRSAAKGGALLGLDLGTKTIGVAISDGLWTVASPLKTIKRTKFTKDAGEISTIVKARQITGIVLGLPLNMDGSAGPRVQSTKAFATNLTRAEGFEGLAITFWDERLSTVAAERALLEADASRKKRGEVIDNVAAAYILQGALDRFRHLERDNG